MSAKRRLAVSVGGLWLCSGRLDQKKIKKNPGASGLVFLSLTSGLVFLTFLFWLGPQRELRCRDLRDTRSPNPLFFLWTQHGNAPNGRRQFPPSALARCRSSPRSDRPRAKGGWIEPAEIQITPIEFFTKPQDSRGSSCGLSCGLFGERSRRVPFECNCFQKKIKPSGFPPHGPP